MLPILLVEDSTAIGALLRARLRHELGREVVWTRSRQETIEALGSGANRFAAALVDYCLPDASEGEVIGDVAATGIPTIVFTGNMCPDVRARIWKQPVVDYVLKDQLNSLDYVVRLLRRIERNPTIGALVVDDSLFFRNSIAHHLEVHRYRIFKACHGREALVLLKEHPEIRLVVADYEMPVMDGFELARTVRATWGRDRVAIIGMSSADDPMVGARFLKCGADDYVIKANFLAEEFYARVSHAIEYLELLDQTREAAWLDSLTGLRNRRYLTESGPPVLKVEDGSRRPACVLIDIDHFKRINDTRGHDTGDRALQHVAGILRGNSAAGDLLVRFGGEEFCLLRPDGDAAGALAQAERLRAALEATPLILADGTSLAMTASFGLTGDMSGEFATVLARADRALYRAKAAGRNRVCGDLAEAVLRA
jgi:diguanylate cyclase (GGDEF)-like protein